jgi:hypothetical protein
MKKNLRKLTLLFLVIFVFSGLMSCELFNDEDTLAIIGEWDTGYGSLDVTSAEITTYNSDGSIFWSYEIDSFDNSEWNGDESGEGNYGYMVVKCTEPSEYTPEAQDKYTVIRWQNFVTETSMEYSEGYIAYFDTAEEAIAGATISEGFFNLFSSTTKL